MTSSSLGGFSRALIRQRSRRTFESVPPTIQEGDAAEWFDNALRDYVKRSPGIKNSRSEAIFAVSHAGAVRSMQTHEIISPAWNEVISRQFSWSPGYRVSDANGAFTTAVRSAFAQAGCVPWIATVGGHHGTNVVARARQLEARGHSDQAIDLIYDHFDRMLGDNKFRDCEQLIDQLVAHELSTDLIISVLTATLPWRSQIAARQRFLQRARLVLAARGEADGSLLFGLD